MKEQICFSCENACNKCNWSRNFKPVDGWEAEEILLPRNIVSFNIKKCPEYVYDGLCKRCVNFDENEKVPEMWYLKCEKHSKLGDLSCRNYRNKYLF